MSEVVVVVTMQAHAGKEGEMAEVLTAGSAATHQEQGCVVYAMHQGADDPSRFSIVEVRASRADLEAHLALPEVGSSSGGSTPSRTGSPRSRSTTRCPPGTWRRGGSRAGHDPGVRAEMNLPSARGRAARVLRRWGAWTSRSQAHTVRSLAR